MTKRTSEKKEGAQIYMSKKSKSIIKKMKITEDQSKVWMDRDYQTHLSIPVIDYYQSESFENERMSDMLFCITFLERCFSDGSYMDIAKNKLGKVESVRVSNYALSLKDFPERISMMSDAPLSRGQSSRMIDSLKYFISIVRELDLVSVQREVFDSKGDVRYIEFEVRSNNYFLMNKKLYETTIFKSSKDARALKNSVSAFALIMSKARKNSASSAFSKNAESKIRDLLPGVIFSKEDARKVSGYRYYDSTVCYSYISSIASDLGITKNTIGSIINHLADIGVISYMLIRDREGNKERYFITDSYSERYLVDAVLNNYKSAKRYSLIRVKSVHGECE